MTRKSIKQAVVVSGVVPIEDRLRAKGNGTIYRDRQGYAAGISINGKRERMRHADPAVLEQWLDNKVALRNARLAAGDAANILDYTDWTMDQLLDLYIAGRKERVTQLTLKPKSLQSDIGIINRYIRADIGKLRCDALTGAHIREVIEGQQNRQTTNRKGDNNKPITNRTAQMCRNVVKQVIDLALERDIPIQASVPKYLAQKIRDSRKKPIITWSAAECKAFLDHNKDNRYYALYALALAGGMRKGELLGLHWREVNLEIDSETGLARGTIQVVYNLQRVTGQGLVLGDPKSESGKREVTVAHAAAMALMAWRERQAAEKVEAGAQWSTYEEGDYVFTTPLGTPVEPRNLKRHFDDSITSYATTDPVVPIKKINFHALRHTCATLLLSNRRQHVPAKYVQRLLGHSSIAITLDLYSHVIQDDLNDLVAKSMNQIFA